MRGPPAARRIRCCPSRCSAKLRMPHATPQLDWELARSITRRLLASAPEVHFSYAKQKEAAEARPSRLIAQLAGEARKLPPELPSRRRPRRSQSSSRTAAAFLSRRARFPAAPRSYRAVAMPFKAFATARLAVQSWKPAETGLTAAERGSLLHAVLHSIWDAAPGDRSASPERKNASSKAIRSHRELLSLTDRKAFVSAHVQRVFADELRPHQRERMPSNTLKSSR